VFFPYYSTMMLGLESNTVIGLRMLRIGSGGGHALSEIQLMIGEKVDAAFESTLNPSFIGIGNTSPRMRQDCHFPSDLSARSGGSSPARRRRIGTQSRS